MASLPDIVAKYNLLCTNPIPLPHPPTEDQARVNLLSQAASEAPLDKILIEIISSLLDPEDPTDTTKFELALVKFSTSNGIDSNIAAGEALLSFLETHTGAVKIPDTLVSLLGASVLGVVVGDETNDDINSIRLSSTAERVAKKIVERNHDNLSFVSKLWRYFFTRNFCVATTAAGNVARIRCLAVLVGLLSVNNGENSNWNELFQLMSTESTAAFPPPFMMLWTMASDSEDVLSQFSAMELLTQVLDLCVEQSCEQHTAITNFISSPTIVKGLIFFCENDESDDLLRSASLKLLAKLCHIFSGNDNLREAFVRAMTKRFILDCGSGSLRDSDKLTLIACLANFSGSDSNLNLLDASSLENLTSMWLSGVNTEQPRMKAVCYSSITSILCDKEHSSECRQKFLLLVIKLNPDFLSGVFSDSRTPTHTSGPTEEKLSALALLCELSNYGAAGSVVSGADFINWCCACDESHQNVMELKYTIVENILRDDSKKSLLPPSAISKLQKRFDVGTYYYVSERPNFDLIDGV